MNCVYVSDFVLVWEVKSRRKRRAQSEGSAEPREDEEQVIQEESRSEKRKAQLARWRDRFIQNVQSAGLLLEKVQLFIMFLIRTWVRDHLKYYVTCISIVRFGWFPLPGGIIQCKKDSTLSEAECSMGGIGVLCWGIMPQSTATG